MIAASNLTNYERVSNQLNEIVWYDCTRLITWKLGNITDEKYGIIWEIVITDHYYSYKNKKLVIHRSEDTLTIAAGSSTIRDLRNRIYSKNFNILQNENIRKV